MNRSQLNSQFASLPHSGSFAIARKLVAECSGPADPSLPDIGPTAPFKRTPRAAPVPDDLEVVPGERPVQFKGKWAKPPGRHPVPRWLKTEAGLAQAARKLERPAVDAASHAERVGACSEAGVCVACDRQCHLNCAAAS